jgi:hypothetical protein
VSVHKEKIKKIMKFEKVMKKFCREIGIDKATLMSMIVGRNNGEEGAGKNDLNSSRKDPFS